MTAAFIIEADFSTKSGSSIINYFERRGALFTSWSADKDRAHKFDTRALAERMRKEVAPRTGKVIFCKDDCHAEVAS